MDIKEFRALPIIGILRGIETDAVEPLIDAIDKAGLKTIEITMNTKGAADLIRKAVRVSSGRLMIGAGTVTDMTSLKAALDSGASFIVMPIVADDVIAHCVKKKIPVFPGALSPNEIHHAWKLGATMVKVFPSGVFGPAYFREVRGPFGDIELLACGGVTPDNMKDYFAAGARAVAFGASVFRKEWLAAKDFASITGAIQRFTTQNIEVRK